MNVKSGALAAAKPPQVKHLTVDAEDAERRLDRFLEAQCPGVPRTRIQRMIRTGEVRVNGGRAKGDRRLVAGDVVRIPPLHDAPPPSAEPVPLILPPIWRERLQAAILVEDAQILALNKPAGIAVHGGSGLAFGVIEALRVLRPDLPHLELVHRLDRETSGCLVLAKSARILRQLHTAFRTGTLEKEYLALAVGDWSEGPAVHTAALAKSLVVGGERRVRLDPAGKEAITRFRPTERFRYAGLPLTLMEIHIETGRTHQIRVQAAAAGHPLAGDLKYGDDAANRRLKAMGLGRLFLHARRLTLHLTGEEAPRRLVAPLPADLRGFLERLRAGDEAAPGQDTG